LVLILRNAVKTRTWLEALSRFIVQADEAGVLVMCSGVVMNNNRRPLDPDEFRGFAISDDLAPLVFINGKDSKSAQMFTLAHELAHIWLGKSAVSDARPTAIPSHEVEAWCNRVAAEMLVPVSLFRNEYRGDAELRDEVRRLAGYFKVSTLVILRRIYDVGGLSQGQFWQEYDKELEFLKKIRKGSGGDFYLTQAARVSRRFARSLVVSALEGRASFTEAFRLLGVKKMTTFHELGRSLGVAC
jgi:Zn-dependent peptidase ImmA (M78 family)